MSKKNKEILNVLWYLVVFVLIQLGVTYATLFIEMALHPQTDADLNTSIKNLLSNDTTLVLISVIGSVLTIALFVWRKWVVLSRTYLRSNPWFTLLWVVFLGLGSILPLQWIYEQLNISLSMEMEEMFKSIMGNRWGYLALGILAPLAEEMVFRGAILRTLLNYFNGRMYWIPIIVSALLFGLVHGNMAQLLNAFLIGILLGWMYYRTESIVPGIVLHWVNNTVAYTMYKLMPQMNDGKLIDFFHGNNRLMYMGLACSLLVFIPSLYQLYVRLRKADTP
ncbi:CAAX amino terminal protease family protein [Hoylesella saccharolytica F0055]|uniref:CAAX amino terminal protease family protein n=1 Tax=Hoylesella saccharolytica F0055 TaxID=1127699 RepID=L1N6U6_9BACT|nr:CPBP family intramembrane glutamic endopeptidase [Hoylesella saccharolytica]EKX98911.1 CAAX amino terminal protease family protein [Hoylesella saccharolytica F0055]